MAAGFRIATSGASERQGIVQRLDVGTSGVMVICKGERAYSVLKNAFRHRTVDKVYHALVQGHPDPLVGHHRRPDRPASPKADYKFAVMADGRHSVTHYETLEAHRFASLLEVHLETGRTHQIRVHMAALKHPCVGDLTYGADPTLSQRVGLQRQWLHAVRLGFEHPDSGEYVEYESPYPPTSRMPWRSSVTPIDADLPEVTVRRGGTDDAEVSPTCTPRRAGPRYRRCRRRSTPTRSTGTTTAGT